MRGLIQGIMDDPFALLCVVLYAAAGLITGVWVAVDARKNRVATYGNDYNFNTGAVAWFLGCLFLWLLVVPVYFMRRASILRRGVEQQSLEEPSSLGRTVSSMARDIISLVILVTGVILGGIGGWYLGWIMVPAPFAGAAGFGALAIVGPGALLGLIVGWAVSRWVY
jgi:hypothetical protein